MPTLLFGSISTLVDTSEIQRGAFNQAFVQHGLDWSWERDEYRDLLAGNGGQQRIADYAEQAGVQVDAAAVHATKSEIFRASLDALPLNPRPGVQETVEAAVEQGWRLALVTTTSAENVEALLSGLDSRLPRERFELILDRSDVDEPKPDPEAYLVALERLGETAANCVAIEDNVGGLQSATKAGITCVVFANENTAGHDFGDAPRSTRLDLAELAKVVRS